MRRIHIILSGAGLLLGAVPAQAAEPYFYHKQDVAREVFESDVEACLGLSSGKGAQVGPGVVVPANPYGAAIGGFLGGMMKARERRQMRDNIMATCMLDRGYRRQPMSDTVAKEFGKLDEAGRMNRWFALASGPAPTETRAAQ